MKYVFIYCTFLSGQLLSQSIPLLNDSGVPIQVRIWEGKNLVHAHIMNPNDIETLYIKKTNIIQYSYSKPYMIPPTDVNKLVRRIGDGWYQFLVHPRDIDVCYRIRLIAPKIIRT